MSDLTVVIDPEFKNQICSLSRGELEQLEKNMLAYGCLDPLKVWSIGNILLDGHNRFDICKKHNIKFSITMIDLPDREAAADWIDWNQLGRRNLPPDEMSLLRGRIGNRVVKAEERRGGDRKSEAAKNQKHQSDAFDSRSSKPSKTTGQLAEKLGVSQATVERDMKYASAVETVKTVDPMIESKIANGISPPKRNVIAAAKAVQEATKRIDITLSTPLSTHNTERERKKIEEDAVLEEAAQIKAEAEAQAREILNGNQVQATAIQDRPGMSERVIPALDSIAISSNKCRSLEKILQHLTESQVDFDEKDIKTCLPKMANRRLNINGYAVDQDDMNGTKRFRVRKIDADTMRPIPRLVIKDFLEQVYPLIRETRKFANVSSAKISPATIMHRLDMIEKLCDGLSGEIKK